MQSKVQMTSNYQMTIICKIPSSDTRIDDLCLDTEAIEKDDSAWKKIKKKQINT